MNRLQSFTNWQETVSKVMTSFLFDPALFMGLGQMALYNKELKTALNYFDKGLAKNPNCKELLLVLGSLYANNPKLKKRKQQSSTCKSN